MLPEEFKTPCRPRRPPPRPNRSGEAPQPWTTARCSRLLRPLLSRISSLRKDTTASLLDAKDDEHEQETSLGDEQRDDHEWLGPRKRVRLTYSQKRPSRRQDELCPPSKGAKGSDTAGYLHRSRGKALNPGEIVPATPLLRRARGHIIPSSPAAPSNLGGESRQLTTGCRRDPRLKKGIIKNKDHEQRLAKLRTQSTPDRYNDLEAIYRSLEALLTATHRDTNQRRGPRSFLDMCLRKVPQYIEALEAQERMDAEQNGTVSTLDNLDTSAEVYNYLEDIGPNPALGWKHLRVVVRSDGLHAIKQAILDGIFGDEFSELLIDLCVQAGASAEAEELVTALIDRQYPPPTTPDSSFSELASLRPLTVLWNFATKQDRIPFLLRQYSLLLSYECLPEDWLSSREFERIWALAARHLSKVDAADDAVAFMNHSISLLCCRKRVLARGPDASTDIAVANKQTLISALTMLTAMSSLGEIELQSARVSESEITKISLIGNRLRCILRSCMADLELPRPARHDLGNDLLYLALFLSSSTARNDDSISSRLRHGVEQAWRANVNPGAARGSRTKHRLDDIASFLSSVARSCGRGMSVTSHKCLETLFSQLDGLGLDREILSSMKAVSAFALAQQTNDVKDFIYAEKLASSQHAAATKTDDNDDNDARPRRSLFSGYRWEETIGEWVTVSPERRRPRMRIRQFRSSSRMEMGHGEEGASQAGGSTFGDADNVASPEIASVQGSIHSNQGPLAVGTERVNVKKRAYSCSKADKPRVAAGATIAYRSKQFTKSAILSLDDDDELNSDKENQNHAMAKKPRRSIDKRTVLSLKPRSSFASAASIGMPGDDCSDDELCM
ncbi:uncharacterized protein GGS22DRAFT_171015 [Annulohypoxylon maeteangense]|uniref:uncharacterized protein n=1 Tax=Annulohypoxylon maeteangense TaxID=1927788 RepID=UPI002007D66F|nr:uncharacterized protein GGS22DRAFT_171015 [Annulohypoxylon maeteangense]KAI0881897.1 hypothetical protein GGS22DRAFT_171015 [Annulohypoxylon maeteangense]